VLSARSEVIREVCNFAYSDAGGEHDFIARDAGAALDVDHLGFNSVAGEGSFEGLDAGQSLALGIIGGGHFGEQVNGRKLEMCPLFARLCLHFRAQLGAGVEQLQARLGGRLRLFDRLLRLLGLGGSASGVAVMGWGGSTFRRGRFGGSTGSGAGRRSRGSDMREAARKVAVAACAVRTAAPPSSRTTGVSLM